MARKSGPKTGRRTKPGKIVSPRSWPLPEGGYKEFLITDIFNVCNTHNILSSEVRLGSGKIPYLTAGESNNSIAGYIDYNHSLIETGNVVFIGGKTMTVTYQENDFYSNDSHNLILTPRPGIRSTKRCQLFYVTSIKKSLSHKYHWGNSISKAKIQSDTISLPIDKYGEIDFDFMESRIREREESRIRELEAYLYEAGFDNCELSQSEAETLSLFKTGKIEWKHFKMGTLYDKLELKNKAFDKRKDTSTTPNEKFTIPLVNAKHGDNGIMYYGKSDIFDSSEMTIDIVQNGAIATGNVYAQPQRTGVLWDAYLIKAKTHNDTVNSLLFMACAIQKSIKSIFSYDKKATWNRVKHESIPLPVDLWGEIDYSLIESFVSAIKKKAIQSLKEFIEQEHNAYISVTR